MLIWRGGVHEPLNIRVVISDTGKGAFELWRFTPQGTYEHAGQRADGTRMDDDAHFGFSAEQLTAWLWQPLTLRLVIVAGNPAAQDMRAYMRVDQNSGPLSPIQAGQNANMLANGVQLLPVLRDNEPGLYDFQVYFQ
ncbi:MAG TPA: hypothetical protein VF548_11520 [Allosphingosinicella sp.]|jgi:hypothetical protein